MRLRYLALATVAAGGLAACGSSDELPPAPEPAVSPPLSERPAGRVVRVGHRPEGLVFDERTGLLAVGLANPDTLALVDGRSGHVVRRMRLPESPRHLRLAAPGGPVLVPAEHADELVQVSLPDGRITRTKVGDFPHDAATAGDRVFVGDEHGDGLSVVEGGRRVRVLNAPVQPGGVVATSDGRYVAVVGVRERALEVIDARTLESLDKVDVGIGPTHVEAGRRRFFVVDTRGDALIELRLDPLRFHRRVFLQGGPYGIAHDRRRGRFWITLTERNQVALVTPRQTERSYPTVRQPNSVAVDQRSGRIWVAGRTGGVLQFFDP